MHLWCLHALDQDCKAVSFSELQGNQIWPLFSFQKHPSLKRRLLCFASYFNFSFLCFGDMDTVAFACLRMSVWESQKQVPWAFLDWQSQNHRSRIWHLLSVWSRPPCHLLMIHFALTSLGAKSVLCLRVSRWTTSASFLPVYSSMFSLFDWFDGSICKRKSNGLCFCMRNSFSVLVPLCLRLGLSLSETQLPGTKVMRRSALWHKESLAASRHMMLFKLEIDLINAVRKGHVKLGQQGMVHAVCAPVWFAVACCFFMSFNQAHYWASRCASSNLLARLAYQVFCHVLLLARFPQIPQHDFPANCPDCARQRAHSRTGACRPVEIL